jgi:undecaprenyl-diphosphatase
MNTWSVAFLAVLQGVTEFLPISSSGHLVMAQHAIGMHDVPILFDLILHLGTASATVLVYHRELWRVVRSLFGWPFMDEHTRSLPERRADARLGLLLITATALTGIIGITLRDAIRTFFYRPAFVPLFFVLTGAVLLGTLFLKGGERGADRTGFHHAAIIGASQAVSILPGVSRSGVTISTGMYLGLEREFSGVFSFLLSIPSVLGASLLETVFYLRGTETVAGGLMSAPHLVLGFFLSLITGYGALRVLLAFLRRGKIHLFSFYCFTAAIVGTMINMRLV